MRSTRTAAAPLCWAALAAVLIASAVACSGAAEEQPTPTGTPTLTPTPTASPTPTPTLAPGQRRRWGYNPLEPTGERDPPIPTRALPSSYRIEQVVGGLDRPTQIAVTPDGRLLITEQAGAVRVVENGRLLDAPLATMDVFLPELPGIVELGLTGIAVDPDFPVSRSIYLYYAADNPRRTVIARIRDEAGHGTEPEEVFSFRAAPLASHIAGGMRFAPDGSLYVGVGDHEIAPAAQDRFQPPGSILRFTQNVGTHPDNPGADEGKFDPHIYAYGLRNPYDIAIDPDTGRIFAGENGFFGQDAIVEIVRGGNYGWPGLDLDVPEREVQQPLTFYHSLSGIAGMEFYSSDVLDEFTGRLLFCRFSTSSLQEIEFLADGGVSERTIEGAVCTSDVLTGPEGYLYLLDYVESVLYRIASDE